MLRTYEAVPSAVTVPPCRPDPKPPITRSPLQDFPKTSAELAQCVVDKPSSVAVALMDKTTDLVAQPVNHETSPVSEQRVSAHARVSAPSCGLPRTPLSTLHVRPPLRGAGHYPFRKGSHGPARRSRQARELEELANSTDMGVHGGGAFPQGPRLPARRCGSHPQSRRRPGDEHILTVAGRSVG